MGETGKDNGVRANDWPEDFAHENGQYVNTCSECGTSFLGHKRRPVCKVCADAPQPPSWAREPEVYRLEYINNGKHSVLMSDNDYASVGSSWISKLDYDTLAERLRVAESEDDAQRTRLTDILTATANALRGAPGPLAQHSWHDLPERVAALQERLQSAREERDAYEGRIYAVNKLQRYDVDHQGSEWEFEHGEYVKWRDVINTVRGLNSDPEGA